MGGEDDIEAHLKVARSTSSFQRKISSARKILDKTGHEIYDHKVLTRERGFMALGIWTIFLVLTLNVLTKQNEIRVVYEVNLGIRAVFEKPFVNDVTGTETSFESIKTATDWYQWLQKVAFSSLVGVEDVAAIENAPMIATFDCVNGGGTIQKKFQCDGTNHCADKSDEAGCFLSPRTVNMSYYTGLDVDGNSGYPLTTFGWGGSFPTADPHKDSDFWLECTHDNGRAETTIVGYASKLDDEPYAQMSQIAGPFAKPADRINSYDAHTSEFSEPVGNTGDVGMITEVDITDANQERWIIQSGKGQYYLLDFQWEDDSCALISGGGGGATVTKDVVVTVTPLKDQCFATEFSCMDNSDQALDDHAKYAKYGNRLGRCLPVCNQCDSINDCTVDGSASEDETQESCSECHLLFKDFKHPSVPVNVPTIGVVVNEKTSCAHGSGPFYDLYDSCRGDPYQDYDNTHLCVGYCTAVHQELQETGTVYWSACERTGQFYTSSIVPALGSIADSDELGKETAKQKDCLSFVKQSGLDGSSSLLDNRAMWYQGLMSSCPEDAYSLVNKMETSDFMTNDVGSATYSIVLFNAASSVVSLVEYMLLKSETGEISTDRRLTSILLNMYDTSLDKINGRIAMESFSLLLLCLFVMQQGKAIHRRWDKKRKGTGVKPIIHWWNLLDLGFIIAYLITMGHWVTYNTRVSKIEVPCLDFTLQASGDMQAQVLSAIESQRAYRGAVFWLLIMMVLETFRVYSFQQQVKTLVSTVWVAFPFLLSMFVLILYVVACFGVMGTLSFGENVIIFSSAIHAVPALVGFVVGEVDYNDLKDADQSDGGYIAPMYYTIMIVGVSIMTVNLVIAIIIQAFDPGNMESDHKHSIVKELALAAKARFNRIMKGKHPEEGDNKGDAALVFPTSSKVGGEGEG